MAPGSLGMETAMASKDDRKKNLRMKNWVLLAVLFGFVALVYVVSIVRMGAQG